MANKRISDLPEATSSTVGDVLAIDGTTTRKITVENLLGGSHVFTTLPLQVGSPLTLDNDPAIAVTRAVDNTGSGDAHGTADTSNISRTAGGPIGYASYDGRVTLSGSGNFAHYAGYQSLPTFSTSGTTTFYHGTYNGGAVTQGTVSSAYLHHAADMAGSGSVTNQYGFYADALVKGSSLNYAFYSAGTTPSKFGGNLDVGGLSIAGTDAAGAWTSWTPTIAATAGTLTTVSANAFYKKIGKTVVFSIVVQITTNGTGSGMITFTLPSATASHGSPVSLQPVFAGLANGFIALTAIGGFGSTTCTVAKYDGTYPGSSGQSLYISGAYEAA